MAHSFVKVTESQQNDSLLLVVAEDGSVTPDKATVESYLKNRSGSTELQIMHVNKTDGQNIDVTLDTVMYVHTEEVTENQEIPSLAEDSLQRDKILRYISMDHDYFSLKVDQPDPVEEPEIVDELAQTLSLLEGGTEEIKPTKSVKATPSKPTKKVAPPSTAKQKAKMITTQTLAPQKQTKPPTPVVPKVVRQSPKPAAIQDQDEESESDEDYDLEFEDDDNDSDFELEDAIKAKTPKKAKRRQTRRVSETKTKPKKAVPKVEVEEKKVEKVAEKEPLEVKSQEVKSAEKKSVKKEKKVPKPPDDFALFSTPDIIRRVGGKEPATPTTPTTPESPKKPAKILFENRSKSVDKKPASIEKPRTSTDEKKTKEIKKTPDKKVESSDIEPQLEPMPSAEDIRSIIQNENTKTFTTSMVIPDIKEQNDQNQIPLEGGVLDLDQEMLDNINSDILSEDILYQVAKSLADNPELQNVIDKSIVDGNLMLDPGIQQAMSEEQNLPRTESQPQLAVMSPAPEAQNRGTQIVRPDGRVVVLPPIERPTTRSRNKKEDGHGQESTPRLIKPLDDEHVSGNELDSSGDEQVEEDDEDPNKLWCICNQPHNGRFMICCDKCTEWYHGKCVGVSKSQGQLMEKQKKEWVCRFCKVPYFNLSLTIVPVKC